MPIFELQSVLLAAVDYPIIVYAKSLVQVKNVTRSMHIAEQIQQLLLEKDQIQQLKVYQLKFKHDHQ